MNNMNYEHGARALPFNGVPTIDVRSTPIPSRRKKVWAWRGFDTQEPLFPRIDRLCRHNHWQLIWQDHDHYNATVRGHAIIARGNTMSTHFSENAEHQLEVLYAMAKLAIAQWGTEREIKVTATSQLIKEILINALAEARASARALQHEKTAAHADHTRPSQPGGATIIPFPSHLYSNPAVQPSAPYYDELNFTPPTNIPVMHQVTPSAPPYSDIANENDILPDYSEIDPYPQYTFRRM